MRNKRNTRRGRAKRWQLWCDGTWLHRHVHGESWLIVGVTFSREWKVILKTNGGDSVSRFFASRAAAMRAAEYLARGR